MNLRLMAPSRPGALRLGALRAPVIVAPMYPLSGPELVAASCRAGLVGSFPAANARTTGELRSWFGEVAVALRGVLDPQWAVSLIVHRSYDRFAAELELIDEYRPNLVVTELGSPRRAVDTVRGYGGAVFAGVDSVEHALKAADAGADGLVLECRRSGGDPMRIPPRVFLDEVRSFFGGPLAVSAGLATGRGVRGVESLGADLAYVGSSFVTCPESRVDGRYRELLARLREDGVTATASLTGVPCSWLAESVEDRAEDSAEDCPDRVRRGSGAVEVAERIVEEYLSAALESRLAAPRGARE